MGNGRWTESGVNIQVGLQHPVPLLGSVSGEALAAAFFFFAFLRPVGRMSLVFAGLAVPTIILSESRGLYVVLPLTAIVLVLRGMSNADRFRLRRLAAAIAVIGVAAALSFALHPAGRFGRATPSLVLNQLGTLIGNQGAGSGSVNTRKTWLHDTTSRVWAHRDGVVQGLGLGPDLTDGFKTGNNAVAVRKPHDDYLEIFARLGLPALILYLTLIWSSLRTIGQSVRSNRSPQARSFQVWVIANSVVYLFMSATQPLLAYAYGTVPLFAVLGAGLAVSARRTPQDRPS